MRIGIDIDGVLTDVGKFTVEEGEKYCKEVGKGQLVNPDAYSTKEVFGWDEQTASDFWWKNIFKYAENNPVIDGAAENIKKLMDEGNVVYIITARWLANEEDIETNDETRNKMRNTVKEWLRKNNIKYDYIIFSGEDKSKHIIENNIDVMIEDSPYNLEQLRKITKMICMNWGYNKEVINENIYRCCNWNEIYEKINEIKRKCD